jgi:hypothetical protein
MPLTNAQIQAAYRARHCKESDKARRLDVVIDADCQTALKRLAEHHRVTQRAMLQRLITDAQTSLLGTLNGAQQDAYFDRVKVK